MKIFAILILTVCLSLPAPAPAWGVEESSFATRLLVLIDGRTVYSPVSSGVYWDEQDVLLEDVERIDSPLLQWNVDLDNKFISEVPRSIYGKVTIQY
jgi:hypothetical protein